MRTNAKVCRRQLDGHTVHFQMSSAQYTVYAAIFKGPMAVKEIAVRAFQVARALDIACNIMRLFKLRKHAYRFLLHPFHA